MKILLLEHPRRIAQERCNDIANTPLSSSLITGYVAGMLASREHEVKIVEGYLDKLSYEEIAKITGDFAPDMLGVHLVYNWESNRELFAFLQEVKGGKLRFLTAYGFYPTFAYQEILEQCPEIDAVIVGEPEQTFAQLAENIAQGQPGSSPLPGLAWRGGQREIIMQRREPEANLDLMPYPLRSEALLCLPQTSIEGSRGCYGGCTFCYINPYYGKPSCWRGRSPENIIAEIDYLIEKYGTKSFYFVDPNFFGPGQAGRERVLRLAALLKERNLIFGMEGRVNDIREDTLGPLMEAGLREMLIGLESGRNESLKRLNKMTTVEQNEKALQILRQYGLEPNVGFIMFEPDSSLEDIRTNFEFLLRNNLLTNLPITANVLYHPQIILQGTQSYQQLQKAGRLQLLATTYEGTIAFADGQVAALAKLMSKITNYLFRRMEGIWSERVAEPPGAEIMYQQANQVLISCFQETLKELETGRALNDEDIEALAEDARVKLKYILLFSCPPAD
jgi:radical SAM superfamily enzyme YgiQ (UPF0313 family)